MADETAATPEEASPDASQGQRAGADGSGPETPIERQGDRDMPQLEPMLTDEGGEPATGFVASDPQPAAPEQATEGEPFAEVSGVEMAGDKVDPFAALT